VLTYKGRISRIAVFFDIYHTIYIRGVLQPWEAATYRNPPDKLYVATTYYTCLFMYTGVAVYSWYMANYDIDYPPNVIYDNSDHLAICPIYNVQLFMSFMEFGGYCQRGNARTEANAYLSIIKSNKTKYIKYLSYNYPQLWRELLNLSVKKRYMAYKYGILYIFKVEANKLDEVKKIYEKTGKIYNWLYKCCWESMTRDKDWAYRYMQHHNLQGTLKIALRISNTIYGSNRIIKNILEMLLYLEMLGVHLYYVSDLFLKALESICKKYPGLCIQVLKPHIVVSDEIEQLAAT
jgi:hypothetical protein